MKYQANPVIVDAYEIKSVAPLKGGEPDEYVLVLDNGNNVIACSAMTARYNPIVGDYFVVQSDGYEYLNPKAVFERKYSKVAS